MGLESRIRDARRGVSRHVASASKRSGHPVGRRGPTVARKGKAARVKRGGIRK